MAKERSPFRSTKTGKTVVFEWNDQLKEAVNDAKAARPVDISPWLFCNRKGQGYLKEDTSEAWGWDSMWQRFMERVLTETKVTEQFTEHDLRAKAGSDADTTEQAGEAAHACGFESYGKSLPAQTEAAKAVERTRQ